MLLRLGERGPEVKELQQALNVHGFDIATDGIYGKGTRRAVRNFQERMDLAADGIAGPNTLSALGLTNGANGGNGNVTDIDFTIEETTIPEPVQERIGEYVGRMEDKHDELMQVMRDALHQFDESMESPSTADADPDILGSLMSAAFDTAVGRIVSHAGGATAVGISFLKSAWDNVSKELERAGEAAVGLSISNWIKDQRVVIDEKAHVDWDAIEEEISLDLLESDDQDQYLEELFEANQRLKEDIVPPVSFLELRLYEQWINAHFKGIADDAPGCIEFRYEYEDNVFDFVSCTVAAPAGDHIETAVNRLLRQNLVQDFNKPLDMNVRKRACFFVENFMPGGRSWSCGWLDKDNNIIHEPIHDPAVEALNNIAWRNTRRFKRD